MTTTDIPSDRPSRTERSRLTAFLLREAHVCAEPERRTELLQRVVLVNCCVAEELALGYRNRGVPHDDLRQVAYEALTKAVQRFDPTLGEDLLTFAVPTIRGELRRYFRDLGWAVRPPRPVQELHIRLAQAIGRLSQDLGHEPATDEVVRHLGISPSDYVAALQAFGCFRPTSLDQPAVDGESGSLGDLLTSEDDLEPSEARIVLAPAVRRLSEREKRVLYLRYFENLSQEEIGRRLGMSQAQVSRLLVRLVQHLREEIGGSTS